MLRMLTEEELGQAPGAARAEHVQAIAASMTGMFADSPVMAADTTQGLAALMSGNLSYSRRAGPLYWALRVSLSAALLVAWPFVGRHHAAASKLVAELPDAVLRLAERAEVLGSAPASLRLSGAVAPLPVTGARGGC
jgi:hypothetical protein